MGKVETTKSALKFLVQKQIEQGSHGFSDADDNEISWDEIIGWLEQQPYEDCISREEALKVMCDSCPMYDCVTGCSSYRYIEKMPSVTPHKAESEDEE